MALAGTTGRMMLALALWRDWLSYRRHQDICRPPAAAKNLACCYHRTRSVPAVLLLAACLLAACLLAADTRVALLLDNFPRVAASGLVAHVRISL